MAKPKEIMAVLVSANSRSLLEPIEISEPCFSEYLNQANYLLFLLQNEGDKGITTRDIAQLSDLHLNTARIYLRSLAVLDLVHRTASGREAIWSLKRR